MHEVPVRHHSPCWRLLEQIQAEVHRFAISFHRDQRSKAQIASRLDYIKGIGPKTKDSLLTHFKSVAAIASASEEELSALVGSKKAALILSALREV